MRGKRWWPEMGSRGREHSVMLWHGPGAGWKGVCGRLIVGFRGKGDTRCVVDGRTGTVWGMRVCCCAVLEKGEWNRIGVLQTSWVRVFWWWTGRQYVQCSISSPCTAPGAPRASRVCRFGARAACRWREVRFRSRREVRETWHPRHALLGCGKATDGLAWLISTVAMPSWVVAKRGETRERWWVVIGQELWSRGFPAYRQLGARWRVSTFLFFILRMYSCSNHHRSRGES